MRHFTQTPPQKVALPDRLPRPPSEPPHEPLIIKMPPGGIIIPEPWPPVTPDEPEIDESDEPTRLPPDMPPPAPEDRPTVPQLREPGDEPGFGPASGLSEKPPVIPMSLSRRSFTSFVVVLAALNTGGKALAQTDGDAQEEAAEPAIAVEQVAPQAAFALELPIERRTKIAHQQYAVTSIDRQENGQFQAVTTFANGRPHEGGYFCAEIGVVGAGDRLLLRIRQRGGVDVSIGWKPTKMTIEDSFDLSAAQSEQADAIDIAHYACRSVDESKIWSGAEAITDEIISDHGGDVSPQPQNRRPRERFGQF